MDERSRASTRLVVGIGALLGALVVGTMIAVLGGATTASGGVSAAHAAGPHVVPERAGRTFFVRKRVQFADIICVKKRAAHDNPGKCQGVGVLKTTDAFRRDPARAQGGNQVWCREWWSELRGLYYVNWKERMQGEFCWVEGPLAPGIPKNQWDCGFSSAIGYDVRPIDCWDQRRTGDTTYGWWISVYDKFRVTAAFQGFPLHWTYQFHVNLHPTGAVKFYVDD